jgi:hypothetical protein
VWQYDKLNAMNATSLCIAYEEAQVSPHTPPK